MWLPSAIIKVPFGIQNVYRINSGEYYLDIDEGISSNVKVIIPKISRGSHVRILLLSNSRVDLIKAFLRLVKRAYCDCTLQTLRADCKVVWMILMYIRQIKNMRRMLERMKNSRVYSHPGT